MFEVKFSAGDFCLLKLMQSCLGKYLLRREIAGAGQLIASCLFGVVESGISGANEIFAGLGIVRSRSDPYAQGDGKFTFCLLEQYRFCVDQLQESFAHLLGPLLIYPGQEYHEFISRIANGMAAVSGRLSEQTGHPDKGLITGFVAVGIVDLLEMVHVHHEQRHRMVFDGVPRDFILQVVQEKAAVVDTGELVFKYQA